MRLAIISDTHLPRGDRALPEACVARLRAAELILHAGDLLSVGFLEELAAIGPEVVAIHGNADEEAVRRRLPDRRIVDVDGVRIGMVHNGGPAVGRIDRLHARFPDCAAVVFGHSHVPLHETNPDGFQIFNPGSATDRRKQPVHTMGEAVVEDGAVRFSLIELD